MRNLIRRLVLSHQEQYYKRFDLAMEHPYRSLFWMHMAALTDLWAVVSVVGLVTGFIRI